MFTISISGTKEEARVKVRQQVETESDRVALTALIDSAPGTQVSISGALSASADGKSGSISLTGSFWTPAP